MLVVLAMGVLISTSSMAETRYYSAISTAIERVQPQARESAELDRKIAILRRRAQTIDTFRMRSKDDLDALSELTQLITPPTWISSFSLTGRGLLVSGQSDQAAALLKIIDASTQFSGSDFSTPVTRDGKLDRFSIRAKRKPVNHDSF
jgi:general secretion pathway protein L